MAIVGLDLIVAKAFEDTLDENKLRLSFRNANEKVITIATTDWDTTTNTVTKTFVADENAIVFDVYVSNSDAPIEVTGTRQPVKITISTSDGTILVENYDGRVPFVVPLPLVLKNAELKIKVYIDTLPAADVYLHVKKVHLVPA